MFSEGRLASSMAPAAQQLVRHGPCCRPLLAKTRESSFKNLPKRYIFQTFLALTYQNPYAFQCFGKARWQAIFEGAQLLFTNRSFFPYT